MKVSPGLLLPRHVVPKWPGDDEPGEGDRREKPGKGRPEALTGGSWEGRKEGWTPLGALLRDSEWG